MKANGWETCETVLANKNGQTGLFTKASGGITKPKERESSLTPMETITRDSGKTIKLMATECSCTLKQEQLTRDIGKTTCSTVLEYRSTATETNMKACSNREDATEKEPTIIPPDKSTREAGPMAG